MSSWKLTKNPVPLSELARSPGGEAEEQATFQHIFLPEDILAINTALAAGRPLLVRGEAGVGKSQLARAAAEGLKRRFVSITVDGRTESQDLLWTFDAVRRLADAQLLAAERVTKGESQKQLDEMQYVTPGPLWWGFQWKEAREHAKKAKLAMPRDAEENVEAPSGVVVLIDEIDKADSSVPNGLLESLGNSQFTGPAGKVIRCTGHPPLVVITTNEERALPDAFLRRCLVRQMEVPTDGGELVDWLIRRGRAHFKKAELADEVLKEAADQLAADRSRARQRGLSPPGGAEYLDLLRALSRLAETTAERISLLKKISDFAFVKHPQEGGGR